MYIHVRKQPVSATEVLRWSARTTAALAFAAWVLLVILDAVEWGPPRTAMLFYQAGALAVVFVGYAVGWRHELVGGALAVAGTGAFLVATWLTAGWAPAADAVWFAAPGILYLLAWLSGHWHRTS